MRENRIMITRCIIYLVLGIACLYLFYMQAIGEFVADTVSHVESSLSSQISAYSLMTVTFRAIYHVAGPYGIAVLLAIVEVATIGVTEVLLKRMIPGKEGLTLLLAVVCNITTAIYLPFFHNRIYVGIVTGNIWHNPTYQLMKLFSLVAIFCYMQLLNATNRHEAIGRWGLFTFACIVSTAFKPSFMVVFGPSVVLMRVVAFVRNRNTWKVSIGIGASFVVALLIIILQYTVLFPGDGSSGIALGFAEVWSRAHKSIPLAMLQSFAFPLIVFFGCARMLKASENYALAWLMFILGLAEFLFLHETGGRMYHGNFAWSLSFACFYLMVVSVGVFFRKWGEIVSGLFEHVDTKKVNVGVECEGVAQRTSDGSRAARVYCVFVLVVLALHLASGLLYFVGVVAGIRPF